MPEESTDIPFPAYMRALEYMGFKIHRVDLENNVVDKETNMI